MKRANSPDRRIIHVDMDAFFASVEELLQPSLKGKPVIVYYPEGIVATASYAARAYGVSSEMPISLAAQLCPCGILLRAVIETYRKYSVRIMSLLGDYSSVMEQTSIDEAFLDVTEMQASAQRAEEIGRAIQQRVATEMGLSCSIGIASNKLVSKIACNSGKPGGFVVVNPGDERAFLSPLPVDQLPGVGESTKAKLELMGVRTIGDLAHLSRNRLVTEFGERGITLHEYSRGVDVSSVRPAESKLTGGRRRPET